MKGDIIVIEYKRGNNTVKRKRIKRELFSEVGIKCPRRKCRGTVFPDRVARRKSRQTTKFGTCACCDTVITIPKQFGKVPQNTSKTLLLKSLRINLEAYRERIPQM